MANITITIPNAIANRVIDGFCKRHGYSSILEDGSINPETKTQFCQRKIREYIKASIKEAEVETAINTAATSAGASTDTDIVLT
jgi:hypothetical protein